MQQIPDLGKNPLGKPDPWARVRGLAWWQLVLSIMPILLLSVGGAIGGAIGAAGLFANLALARKPFGTPVKLLAMLGVVLASYLGYLLVVGLAYNLLKG
ncbi:MULTISPECIES: hypothetical protein [unclassified Streptomyces]|uniref:hypothetical protein n=1 Tax=unclassified Streptomyces TaxID=2593676 RepID=UPI00225A1D42|nr:MULTISPECIES: hypothetical protein [unclassified Streptomyces]MCX4987273.1 hypothetical protein [Streptomyces sp. NBC_00568]MCX5007595.1 hypothetical protein [Streptomyces sp. NBC_00638]